LRRETVLPMAPGTLNVDASARSQSACDQVSSNTAGDG
jgi:hypothetical protein